MSKGYPVAVRERGVRSHLTAGCPHGPLNALTRKATQVEGELRPGRFADLRRWEHQEEEELIGGSGRAPIGSLREALWSQ